MIGDYKTLESTYYVANLKATSHYYPFGLELTNKQYANGEEYRYGFNGKENDREWGTAGLTQNYGFRLHNSGIVRFLSVDPLADSYPWNSTFAFAEGDVIRSVDLDGLERAPTTGRNIGKPKNLTPPEYKDSGLGRAPEESDAVPVQLRGLRDGLYNIFGLQVYKKQKSVFRIDPNPNNPLASEEDYNDAKTLTSPDTRFKSYQNYVDTYNERKANKKFNENFDLDSEDNGNEFVKLYKAPQSGKGQLLLNEGFKKENFPRKPPYKDGKAYFAGPNDRSIAEEYAPLPTYREGILEITIPKEIYDQVFKKYESKYPDGTDKRIELAIPSEEFPNLNQHPRELKPY